MCLPLQLIILVSDMFTGPVGWSVFVVVNVDNRAQLPLYRVPCILYRVPRVSCTVYRVSCTMHCVLCTVYYLSCKLYTNMPCTLYYVYSTVYRVPCTVFFLSCYVYHRTSKDKLTVKNRYIFKSCNACWHVCTKFNNN